MIPAASVGTQRHPLASLGRTAPSSGGYGGRTWDSSRRWGFGTGLVVCYCTLVSFTPLCIVSQLSGEGSRTSNQKVSFVRYDDGGTPAVSKDPKEPVRVRKRGRNGAGQGGGSFEDRHHTQHKQFSLWAQLETPTASCLIVLSLLPRSFLDQSPCFHLLSPPLIARFARRLQTR